MSKYGGQGQGSSNAIVTEAMKECVKQEMTLRLIVDVATGSHQEN